MSRHLSHSGHVRLGDGSVLRIDVQLGEWCASYYLAPRMSLHMYGHGSLEAMSDLVDLWQTAFEMSLLPASPVGGERPGVVSTPTPGHQLGGAA